MGISGTESSMIWILVGVFALMFIFVGIAVTGGLRRKNKISESAADSLKNSQIFTDENLVEVVNQSTSESDQGQEVKDPKPNEKSLSDALKNTEKNFLGRIRGLFSNDTQLKNLEDIEEILLTSDLGPQTVQRLMDKLEHLSKSQKADFSNLKSTLKKEFFEIFGAIPKFRATIIETNNDDAAQIPDQEKKSTEVWMIVGVNGAGKTTSIGKLSAQLAEKGKKVLIAAGDTFRAAASEQLKTWSERSQVDFYSPEGVTDPSAVAFGAVTKAKEKNFDIVLIDTAGRLHTQVNLMEELKKIKRVMTKVIPDAPHEVLLILDANSGQNALFQAREFHQALGLTGVILTKMDGTAKGGVAVGLAHELKVPIRWIGVGEKVGDLRPFSSHEFVDSILGG